MIADPDTTLTDLGLAVESAVLAWLLARREGPREAARGWWLLFFGAAGSASLLGGLYHGFFHPAQSAFADPLWAATLLCLGLPALAGWALGAPILLPRRARGVTVAAAVVYVTYGGLVLASFQDFLVAVAHYLPAAVFLLIALAVAYYRRRARPLGLGLAGMVLIFVGAGLQQAGVALHPVHFDHNAVYHVVQAIALYLLYRGAAWLVTPPGE
jgi:hypothetical protein